MELTKHAKRARRAREVTEMRDIQRRMQAATTWQHPELEVAVYTRPATDVNGDYLDVFHHGDGRVTFAVGDATGHGLKAGLMALATKTLFQSHADTPELVPILNRATAVLKRMHLCRLYMGLLLVRYDRGRVRLAAAGMPPALHVRAETGTVERLRLRGMPLGSVEQFPYEERALVLAPGDALVLMSDGFPELLSARCGRLGYEQAALHVEEVAGAAPQAMVRHLVETAERWTHGEAFDDDLTFAVLQRRGGAAAEGT